MPDALGKPDDFDVFRPLPTAKEWKCVRCGTVLPAREGDQPPTSCVVEAGGCGRETDCGHEEKVEGCESCENGSTRFFPADWGEAHVQLYIDSEMNEGQRLFREVVLTLEKYFIFPEPLDSRLCALFVFQTHIYQAILPLVFYLGVGGPASAGKTTLLEILRDLSWRGVMSGDVSVAALSRMMNAGVSLFLDEADEMDDEQRDLVYGAARKGYRRGQTRIVSVQEGKAWAPDEINIFGCYALSFYNEVDVEPALLTRMVKFEVSRLGMEQVKSYVFLNMARTVTGLGDLKKRVEEFVEKALQAWTPQRAAARFLEPSFQDKVTAIIKATNLPRDLEVSGIMVLVSEVIGVDLVEELTTIFASESRSSIDEGVVDDLEELKDIILSAAKTTKTKEGIRIRFEDLRNEWNARRRQVGDRGEAAPDFRRRLGRLQFRPGHELIHPKNRQTVVWTPHLEALLTGEPNPDAKLDLTRFLSSPNPQGENLTPVLTRVRSQEDRVRVCVYIGLGKAPGSDPIPEKGLTVDEVWERVKGVEGMRREDLEPTLRHLSERGLAYQPKTDHWKAT